MSQSRQPRCTLSINGVSIAPIECTVHLSTHQSADTFYAKVPIDPTSGLDQAFWASTAPIPVSVLGSANGESPTTLLTGNVDQPQIIFHENAVAIRGRDLTAVLTETKVSQVWRNLNDQQVIQQLAGMAGLSVQFTQTPDQAGLQYDQDYSEIADSDTAWNKIVELARKAGCIAFVKGTTLYVQPIDATPPSGMFTVNYAPPTPSAPASSDAVMLFATRNLNLAKDTTVTVQSWQHKQGKSITSSFQSKPKSASADRLIYQRRSANLTKAQQDKIALAHIKETLTHERQIDINNMPGDVSAIAGLVGLTLSGTGTDFDQDYILSDVTHRFSNDGGYMMDLSAHSQDQGRGEPQQVQ